MNNFCKLVTEHNEHRKASCRLGREEVNFGYACDWDNGEIELKIFTANNYVIVLRNHLNLNLSCSSCGYWDYIHIPLV
jgi:hypothetical protein